MTTTFPEKQMAARSNIVLLLSVCCFATAAQDFLLEVIWRSSSSLLGISALGQIVWGTVAFAYWLLVKPDYATGARPLGVIILAIENVLLGLALVIEALILLLFPVPGLIRVLLGGMGLALLWLARELWNGNQTALSVTLWLSVIGVLASLAGFVLGLGAPILAIYQVWYLRRPYVRNFFDAELKLSTVTSPRVSSPFRWGQGDALLSIEGLRTYFYTYAGVVKAVDGVSFQVRHGETLGIVGESGSGKTVTALSIMRIVPPPGKIVEGKIIFQDHNLLDESEEYLQHLRGREIGYIFQDPTSTLDPVYTVGQQLSEVLMRHQGLDRVTASARAVELLRLVEIPDPEVRVNQYPHELSGGTKQRIAIARALSCNPSLLLADEPTTALDVTIQAQILELMQGLKARFNMSMVLISHDLGIVAETCDRIVIIYAGQVYESGTTAQVLENPKHPYTEALLTSVPHLALRKGRLSVIPGNIPNLIDPPSGCRFHPRCKYAQQICIDKVPELDVMQEGHLAACHRAKELKLTSPVAS